MKQRKNLIISYVLILLIGLCLFILSYQNKKQAERLDDSLIHSHIVIEEITRLNTLVTEFESHDQSYVITNNKDYLKGYDSMVVKASSVFGKLKKLTVDNVRQQKNLQEFEKTVDAKLKFRQNIFTVLSSSHHDALLLLSSPEGLRLYEEMKNILNSMLEIENGLLKERAVRYQEALQGRFIYATAFEGLALVVLGIAFWRVYKESVNRRMAEEEANKSEGKYKALIEKSALVIYTTDLHGRFTYISEKGLQLTGYRMEELIGRSFNVLVPEHQREEVVRFYLHQYKDFIKDLVEEFEIRTKDNEIKIIELSTVLIEENGKVTGFQSIARDITGVKYVESLIKESKIKLQQQQEEYNFRMQSVLNNIPMVLYIKDLDGRYLMVNKNFTESFGLKDEMVIGRTNNEIGTFRDKADFFREIDARVRTTGKPIEFEEQLLTFHGERSFLVTKFPLFDKDNNIFAISSVAKDITDMAHHRQQLIDARLKAEKAEQLQEAFLANMSHEIRTPMNGIMGMTNMLLDTSLDNEQKEYADLIKKSSDALLVLINDILDLSKIKAGRMELEAIDFSLKEAVHNVLQPMKVNLKKPVTINYTINDSVPDFVKGDLHKLLQILNNLVGNAVKFTEKGEIRIDVDVIERNDEKIYVKFDVSDTGIGISKEHIKNIFETFTQASNDTARIFGGTGLGLSITKRLVELQNGSIDVQSVPGEGTVFHVEIPYLPTSGKHKSELPINSVNIALSEEIGNRRILIVEDNQVNQRVLTSVLQKIKLQWDIANNGKEAIDKLENGNTYHLIVMDLQMPVMDGFEATLHIRKKLKINTPIIAMSASTLRDEKVKCFDVGMNEYLPKPFSPNELIKHIHNLIDTADIEQKQPDRKQLAEEKLYDLAFLRQLDDNDYLIEMIELFFETTSSILEEMQENVKMKNPGIVGKLSHKLKSSLGAFQISKMLTIATAMEENAKNENNLDKIIFLNKELRSEFNIVKPMLEAELVKAKKISNGFVDAE